MRNSVGLESLTTFRDEFLRISQAEVDEVPLPEDEDEEAVVEVIPSTTAAGIEIFAQPVRRCLRVDQ